MTTSPASQPAYHCTGGRTFIPWPPARGVELASHLTGTDDTGIAPSYRSIQVQEFEMATPGNSGSSLGAAGCMQTLNAIGGE